MAWTDPRTWVIGELVTKAIMDLHVRDNLNYLKDQVDVLVNKLSLAARQGGSATDWSSGGGTDYTPATAIIQCGVSYTDSADSNNTPDGYVGSVTVTFPVAFSNKPVVIATGKSSNNWIFDISISSVSSTQVVFRLATNHAGADAGTVNWLAIGPE